MCFQFRETFPGDWILRAFYARCARDVVGPELCVSMVTCEPASK